MIRAVHRILVVAILSLVIPSISLAQDINGTWHFDYGYDMTFSGSGGSFTGHGAGNGYTWPVTNGVISGNSISWHESYDQINYTVDRIGTINGDTMSGTYTTGGGGGTGVAWSATRISSGGGPTPTATPGSNGGKRPTKLSLFCNRTGVLLETADCAATVADAGPQPVSLPTGTIYFQATNGFFPASGSCNPVQTPYSPGIGSCKAVFQIPNGFPTGAKFPIEATYGGDATFDQSSTSHTLFQAGCIGTAAKPCSGAVAMSFADVPAIVKNILTSIVSCGGGITTKPKAYQVRGLGSGSCSIGLGLGTQTAEMLSKLGLDQGMIGKVAEELDKQNLGNDAMLKGLRDLYRDASTNPSLFDQINVSPGALNKALQEYMKKQGKSLSGVRSLVIRRAISVSFGTATATVKSNKSKTIKIRLSAFGKKLTTALRNAGVHTINLTIKLVSERIGTVPKGAKRKVSVKQSLDVAL